MAGRGATWAERPAGGAPLPGSEGGVRELLSPSRFLSLQFSLPFSLFSLPRLSQSHSFRFIPSLAARSLSDNHPLLLAAHTPPRALSVRTRSVATRRRRLAARGCAPRRAALLCLNEFRVRPFRVRPFRVRRRSRITGSLRLPSRCSTPGRGPGQPGASVAWRLGLYAVGGAESPVAGSQPRAGRPRPGAGLRRLGRLSGRRKASRRGDRPHRAAGACARASAGRSAESPGPRRPSRTASGSLSHTASSPSRGLCVPARARELSVAGILSLSLSLSLSPFSLSGTCEVESAQIRSR